MNSALRQHTTSVGFMLTLTKRQIDLLVLLDFFGDFDKAHNWEHSGGHERVKLFGHWCVSGSALGNRGLVHVRKCKTGEATPTNQWKLTRAGRLVVGLLKEAGIYQDRVTELGMEHPKVAS